MARIFFILLTLATCSLQVNALNYYWVGGSGNWSDINHWATASGGATKHIVVPSPDDNVFFDANSFTTTGQSVNIDLPIATARNFTISNVQHNPTFNGGGEFRIYGSLTLSANANWSFSGTFYFAAVTPGHTITTAGNSFVSDLYFQGIGGEWTLNDTLVCTRYIYLDYGTLNTNNKVVQCMGLISPGPTQPNNTTRSLTLGSSKIFLRNLWSVNMANLTLNTGTSVIRFSENGTFATNGAATATYHTLCFDKDGIVSGNNNFDTLRLTKGYKYTMSGNGTVSKLFDAVANCVQIIRLTGPWNLTMPANAQFLLEYATVEGINASGGANFTAYESIDKGGNTGITFIPLTPYDLYWVGGTGDWHDTTYWSYTSGGPGGACIPRSIDNVWFDANSFVSGDIVTISSEAECHDMRWVNLPADITLTKLDDLDIYGSMWLHHNLTWAGAMSETFFVASVPGKTITTDNVILTGPFYFDGTGSWTLMDDFAIDGSGIEHIEGTVITNNNTVTSLNYHSSAANNRTLPLGSSHIIISGAAIDSWALFGVGFTLNAGTSLIEFTSSNAGMYNANTPGFVFYDVLFSDSAGLSQLNTDINIFNSLTFNSNGFIRGQNEFGTLNFTKGKDYSLAYGNTQHIVHNLNAIGGCDGYILIHSDEQDYITHITKNSGTINCEYLIMWNVDASGGATFNAFNSVDIGGNTGWNFTQPNATNLYWVGGTGDWSDVSHWSYTSGGPGGACVPNPLDSVFFDNNSFLNPNDTVYVDLTNATAYTMTWKDTLMGAVLTGLPLNNMWFWGSVIFSTDMQNDFNGVTYFVANTPGHIIVSANNSFNADVIFEGVNGSWSIVDSLVVTDDVTLKHGYLHASEKYINVKSFQSNFTNARGLDISDAIIEITGYEEAWEIRYDSLQFNAAGSDITFTSQGIIFFRNYKITYDTVLYHNVTFTDYFSAALLQSVGIYCVFNVATFIGNGTFDHSSRFDSLMLNSGHTYMFTGGTTQTFNHISAEGTCFHPITFNIHGGGTTQYDFHSLTPTAEVNYVTMYGCNAIGTATYLANNSTDVGNNTNWAFTAVGPADLYWVNGTGNWWDPNHWSYSSGGPGGACIPTYKDNVFFDQNSFLTASDSVNVDSTFAECRNMEWININSNPFFSLYGPPLNIYGSLRLDTAIIGDFWSKIRFFSNDTGNFIYCGSQVFNDSVVFLGSGGWILYDSLTTTRSINLIRGHLNTNGQTVTAANFISITPNNRILTLGASKIKLNSLWRLNGLNLTFNSGQSTIQLSFGNANVISENGQGFIYHNVLMLGDGGLSQLRCNNVSVKYNKVVIYNNGTILGQHTFDSLLFMPGNLYKLEHGKTQVINDYWLLRGNNCYPLTLQSTLLGHQATVQKAAGVVVGDFLHIRDINATGNATFFAGDNSSDVDNNNGWTFSNSPGYIFGLGPDILFTIGSSVTLSTANFNAGPGTSFLWSTGETTANIIVTQPGTYSVTVTYAGNCIVIDTIVVYCDVKPTYTIGDCICYGDSTGWINMTINDTVGTYTAIWSHGPTQLNVSGLTAGQYIVHVIGSTGCDGKDTLYVGQPPPVVVPLNDTSFCEDDIGVLLDATSAYKNFWWNGQPGPQTLFIYTADTVVVWVEDFDGCFSDPKTIIVDVDSIPFIFLGDDEEICLGEHIKLTPGPGFDSYLWQDGSAGESFTAYQGGTYHVTIKLRTCYNSDTIFLYDCPPNIRFPNVFTPNGDGFNDYFFPVHQNIINYKLVVYNRWGNIVFSTVDVYQKWDGTTNGHPCPEGTYFYTVEYEGFGQKASRGKKLHRGIVTILK